MCLIYVCENQYHSKVFSSETFQCSKLPSGKYLLMMKGIFFSASSFSAMDMGSVFTLSPISTQMGAFLEIWTALTPMILALQYLVMQGEVILCQLGSSCSSIQFSSMITCCSGYSSWLQSSSCRFYDSYYSSPMLLFISSSSNQLGQSYSTPSSFDQFSSNQSLSSARSLLSPQSSFQLFIHLLIIIKDYIPSTFIQEKYYYQIIHIAISYCTRVFGPMKHIMKKKIHRAKTTINNIQLINYKIRPVIVKKGNKFVYTDSLFRRSARHYKIQRKKKKQTKNQFEDINEISENQLIKYSCADEESNEHMVHLKKQPFLINKVENPTFTMPEYLEVSIHEGQKIDYTDNTLYYRISTQQVLANKEELQGTNFNVSVPQMELDSQNYQVPRLAQLLMKKLHKVNLWIYFGKRLTEWHYDGHDNLLYVLKGGKIVYLAEPNSIKSNTVFSLFNNHRDSKQQVKTKVYKAVVKNRKSLFIPKGWWHRVESFGQPSLAINFWGDSANQILNNLTQTEKTLVIKNLLFQLAEEHCKKVVPNWINFTQAQKEEFRQMAGHKLIEEGCWKWKLAQQEKCHPIKQQEDD